VLSGTNFGYLNHVRAKDGGAVALNADFDQFSVVPVPGAVWLMVSSLGLLGTLRRRAKQRPVEVGAAAPLRSYAA